MLIRLAMRPDCGARRVWPSRLTRLWLSSALSSSRARSAMGTEIDDAPALASRRKSRLAIVSLPRTHSVVSPAAAAAWCGAACGALLLATGPASAQVTPWQVDRLQQQIETMQRQYQRQIEALQQQQKQQMEALQQQLQSVQSQAHNTQVQQRHSRSRCGRCIPCRVPAEGDDVADQPAGNLQCRRGNCIELTSRLHLDFGDYLNVTLQAPSGPHLLTSGVNARRARIRRPRQVPRGLELRADLGLRRLDRHHARPQLVPEQQSPVLLNYIHSDLDKLATNGSTPARVKIDAVALRAQVFF